ncbi:hypothetical protein B0J15DRAFT_458139 [Fusarium solani]|uniref:Uncharacterized protein n=1 Tax=Fusarium solani TaxID=169388 RepID=A0A9P9REG3_FUSSL|nr:uncharacterized protein B0J15DRAFT_458139 [Fusarium solani]KAH7276007.1 hypothetical protein B0J15DRAFT_458139 [Fusarium solani]
MPAMPSRWRDGECLACLRLLTHPRRDGPLDPVDGRLGPSETGLRFGFFSFDFGQGPSSRGSRYYLPTARRKLPARNRTGTRCAPRGGRAGDHSEEATERKIDGGGQNSCSVNQACFGLTSSRRRVSSTELTHWLFVYQPTTLINPVACGCPSPSLFSNTSMETETLSHPILQSAIAQHRNGCCPGSSSQPPSSLLSVSPDGGPVPHLSPSLIVPGRRTPDLLTAAVRSARESVRYLGTQYGAYWQYVRHDRTAGEIEGHSPGVPYCGQGHNEARCTTTRNDSTTLDLASPRRLPTPRSSTPAVPALDPYDTWCLSANRRLVTARRFQFLLSYPRSEPSISDIMVHRNEAPPTHTPPDRHSHSTTPSHKQID